MQVPTWGQQASALAPSFSAPFGSVPDVVTTVLSAAPVRGAAPPGGTVVSARTWMEPCAELCAHVVVVNLDQQSPVCA